MRNYLHIYDVVYVIKKNRHEEDLSSNINLLLIEMTNICPKCQRQYKSFNITLTSAVNVTHKKTNVNYETSNINLEVYVKMSMSKLMSIVNVKY